MWCLDIRLRWCQEGQVTHCYIIMVPLCFWRMLATSVRAPLRSLVFVQYKTLILEKAKKEKKKLMYANSTLSVITDLNLRAFSKLLFTMMHNNVDISVVPVSLHMQYKNQQGCCNQDQWWWKQEAASAKAMGQSASTAEKWVIHYSFWLWKSFINTRKTPLFICIVLLLMLHCLQLMLQFLVVLQPQLQWNILISVTGAYAQKPYEPYGRLEFTHWTLLRWWKESGTTRPCWPLLRHQFRRELQRNSGLKTGRAFPKYYTRLTRSARGWWYTTMYDFKYSKNNRNNTEKVG